MDPEKAYRKVFGLQVWDPVRRCRFIQDGIRGAEELRLPPRSEGFESTAEERSVTAERKAGLTGPGAGATRREEKPGPALRTPGTGVEATPRRARGSSWKVSDGDISR